MLAFLMAVRSEAHRAKCPVAVNRANDCTIFMSSELLSMPVRMRFTYLKESGQEVKYMDQSTDIACEQNFDLR